MLEMREQSPLNNDSLLTSGRHHWLPRMVSEERAGPIETNRDGGHNAEDEPRKYGSKFKGIFYIRIH